MQGIIDARSIEALKQLEERTGKPLLMRLVTMFEDHMPAHIKNMRDALAAQNTAIVASEAHACKSMSGNLGAHVLATNCKAIEEATAESVDLDTLKVLVEGLDLDFKLAMAELDKLLGKASA